MVMTNQEIVRDYQQAKSPLKQIAILAECNACEKQKIVEIIAAAGCELPGQYKSYAQEAAAAVKKPEPLPQVDRAKKPVPAVSQPVYTEVLWWLAYGAGACLAIEDENLRHQIVRCFENAHDRLKELSA